MNATFITGRLTRDPEQSTTQDGKTKTSFTVAVDRPFKKKDAKFPESDFYYCIAFDKSAEFIGKYFKKGRAIELILAYRQYKNSENQTSHFFLVEKAGFVPRDAQDQTQGDGAFDPQEPPYEPNITDDDIPF